ncbi:MAG: helix-turn-helix transcriptional regulator [Lachnospiraceae bacterium]|nr:helix-turn-helix transcriptional regulator [Lachnospiraceae bacterium]
MTIQDALKQKNMSIYRLAKESGIPYATVNDVCNGKARLEKCSAETIYRLSRALGITMEDLLAPCFMKRAGFENFKSAVCHRLKELGDIDFIINTLESGEIRTLFDLKWYPESLYLLAMLDYISRENGIPLCDDYDDLRRVSLEKPVFPAGISAMALVSGDKKILRDAARTSIPEFMRFNIIENEVKSVV